MAEEQKDNLNVPYTTKHGQPALSGETVTTYTSNGRKEAYMLDGRVTDYDPK